MSAEPNQEYTKSAVAAVAAIRNGQLLASELTKFFLEKIASENNSTHAITQVLAKQARTTAADIDERLSKGQAFRPLEGLPVLIKENCDTQGAICSAGLSFRKTHKPQNDSGITKLLKKAGAVILGVTASDPGAFSTRTPNVVHPNDDTLTVGGSSGGSAAALLSGMCLGAIGTDTGGSIRIPSACCSTVGLKPTFNALPMNGIFPLVKSLDHVGPMTRNVDDVCLIWEALSQSVLENEKPVIEIGFDPKWISESDKEIQNAICAVLSALEADGIKLRELKLPDLDEISATHGTIFIVEALKYHMSAHWRFRDQYPPIAQEWFELARETSPSDFQNANAIRADYTKTIDRYLQEVDFILGPTMFVNKVQKTAQTIDVAGKNLDFTMAMVRGTALFDHTGHPALAMPAVSNEMTVAPSLQIVGSKNDESNLLKFACRIERLVG